MASCHKARKEKTVVESILKEIRGDEANQRQKEANEKEAREERAAERQGAGR